MHVFEICPEYLNTFGVLVKALCTSQHSRMHVCPKNIQYLNNPTPNQRSSSWTFLYTPVFFVLSDSVPLWLHLCLHPEQRCNDDDIIPVITVAQCLNNMFSSRAQALHESFSEDKLSLSWHTTGPLASTASVHTLTPRESSPDAQATFIR